MQSDQAAAYNRQRTLALRHTLADLRTHQQRLQEALTASERRVRQLRVQLDGALDRQQQNIRDVGREKKSKHNKVVESLQSPVQVGFGVHLAHLFLTAYFSIYKKSIRKWTCTYNGVR